MNEIIQKKGKAEKISAYLMKNRNLFIPPLDERVNISEYSKKIYDNAIQFWVVKDNLEIGFMACYFNDPQRILAYVTTISVLHEYQGLGYGRKLINKAISYTKTKNFSSLKLEVNKENLKAIAFYQELGFLQFAENLSSLFMIYKPTHNPFGR